MTGSPGFAKLILAEFGPLKETLNFDRSCQLFAFLLQHDVLRLIRRHYRKPLDEPVPSQDVINYLGSNITSLTRATVTDTIETFNKGAQYGEILKLFCKELGMGSLLLLCDHLDLEL